MLLPLSVLLPPVSRSLGKLARQWEGKGREEGPAKDLSYAQNAGELAGWGWGVGEGS